MIRQLTCPCCNKQFIPGSEHLYKVNKQGKIYTYCSYSCWKKNGGDNGNKRWR